MVFKENMAVFHDTWQSCPETNENNKKLLRGVKGGGFLEKNPPGRRKQMGRGFFGLSRPPPLRVKPP
jgi:hypothetical protein